MFASCCGNSLRFHLRFKKSLAIAVAMPWCTEPQHRKILYSIWEVMLGIEIVKAHLLWGPNYWIIVPAALSSKSVPENLQPQESPTPQKSGSKIHIALLQGHYHLNFLDYTSPFIFQQSNSVIISPPVTRNKFWGFSKCNSQENYTTLSCPC